MPDNNISVVPVTATSCNPFTLEVMVFSPESGFKFQVLVERSCIKAVGTEPAKTKWKLVFDLFKKPQGGGDFDHIVHVSYTAENEQQAKKLAAMAANGVNSDQSKQLITKVHPAVKDAENIQDLTAAQAEAVKKKVKDRMRKTVELGFDA